MRVLLTGGAGYIGSHVARECLRADHQPIIYDNYSTGHRRSVSGLIQIPGDLLDIDALRRTFRLGFDAVLHFAAPDTSSLFLEDPLERYEARIAGTLNLLQVMRESNVKKLVLCSSAAVYGSDVELPICETHVLQPVTPWGRAMLLIEQRLAELAVQGSIQFMALRTFCVGGADPWGDIGDDRPRPTHLIPRLFLTHLSRFDSFEIFGTDFETPDGTCVRDLVHVVDVARAHVLAVEALDRCANQVINIGTGVGYSVREVVSETLRTVDERILVTLGDRRPLDPPVLVAFNDKARALLEWEPVYSDLHTILETSWYWHKRHPQGYASRERFLEPDPDLDLLPEV